MSPRELKEAASSSLLCGDHRRSAGKLLGREDRVEEVGDEPSELVAVAGWGGPASLACRIRPEKKIGTGLRGFSPPERSPL